MMEGLGQGRGAGAGGGRVSRGGMEAKGSSARWLGIIGFSGCIPNSGTLIRREV